MHYYTKETVSTQRARVLTEHIITDENVVDKFSSVQIDSIVSGQGHIYASGLLEFC